MKDFETKRFIIRKSEQKDAEIYEKILLSNDKYIIKNSVEMSHFSDDVIKSLCILSAASDYCYSVIDKDTREIIGSLSLRPDELEVGGWVAPKHQGKGYSREFFNGFINMVLEEKPYVIAQHYSPIVCNLFAKCGMKYIGEGETCNFITRLYKKNSRQCRNTDES